MNNDELSEVLVVIDSFFFAQKTALSEEGLYGFPFRSPSNLFIENPYLSNQDITSPTLTGCFCCRQKVRVNNHCEIPMDWLEGR